MSLYSSGIVYAAYVLGLLSKKKKKDEEEEEEKENNRNKTSELFSHTPVLSLMFNTNVRSSHAHVSALFGIVQIPCFNCEHLIIKYSLFEFNDQKMKCGPLCFTHTTKGLLESNILHFLISKLIL